jgi:4-hydroxybenzoate polyprenyltransferase
MFNLDAYIKLMRPTNWLKNLIIALPFILSNKFSVEAIINLLIGFIGFSIISSGAYIFNDIKDIEKDRQHLKKKHRPLAIAAVAVGRSFFLALTLVVTGLLINLLLGLNAFAIASGYFILNYFYNIRGKQIRGVDILILSTFYIIRIFYGAELSHTPLTGWFMATVTMSVLSLSINKRYMECKMTENYHVPGRGYTKDDESLLQILMINFSLAAIILLNIHAYFVLLITSPYFYYLLNIASAGIIFFYFDYSKNKTEDPVERIFKNKPLLVSIVFFITVYAFEIATKSR